MQIVLALVAEGRTDIEFFRPLLGRVVRDLCATSTKNIDVAEILPVHVRAGTKEMYAVALARGVEELSDAFHILLFHADGAGDPIGVRDLRSAMRDADFL